MMRIAVIGVGRMGAPIARRLAVSADVVAYDIDARRRAHAGPGIAWADTFDAAVAGADVVVTVLPGAHEQREVLIPAIATGSLGRAPGTLLIDLTSGDPATAREIRAAADARGVAFACAPMGGDPAAAEAGALRLLVGGVREAADRAAAVLAPLADGGGEVLHVADDVGAALTAKLLVNALWFAEAVAIAEAVRTGEQAGLSGAALRAVLRGSAADSAFVERYMDRFLAGDEMPGFGLGRVVEELEIVAQLAREAGVAPGVLGASRGAHVAALIARGDAGSGELTAAQQVRRPSPSPASDAAAEATEVTDR